MLDPTVLYCNTVNKPSALSTALPLSIPSFVAICAVPPGRSAARVMFPEPRRLLEFKVFMEVPLTNVACFAAKSVVRFVTSD